MSDTLNITSGYGSNRTPHGTSMTVRLTDDSDNIVAEAFMQVRRDEDGQLRFTLSGMAPVIEDQPFVIEYLDGFGHTHGTTVRIQS